MDFFGSLQRKISDYFAPKEPKLLSPLADKYGGDFIPNKAVAYSMANDESRMKAAHERNLAQYGQATPTPVKLPLNQQIANAPRKAAPVAARSYEIQKASPQVGVLRNFRSTRNKLADAAVKGAVAPPVGQTADASKRIELIKKYFGKDWENALKVSQAESGLNPMAINDKNTDGSIDYGMFQINNIHAKNIADQFGWNMEDLKDPERNIRVAKWIYDRNQGWGPWVAAHKLGLVR